ncbi:histidine phosphatase family protein [Roseomonas marmotae]|uniref:Histidine phosphatase family protein n=1 Tax=Roseomonas marmotae TaxID=2768161 RepID=A0ABS3K9Q2_9PROT|nr:histidine phosphatase family protein [Roseomonas marmotae]MBO1074191.1 histidine phosphatase family protein [Roseomonas marmotae]QTI78964.1 histidine phosphatase family protein [Roseomonas marmotae]
MTYALLRHLPTDIAPGLCYGRLDLPPGAGGDTAAAMAGLAGFPATALFSSPARRCMALAGAVSAATGLPVIQDARLLELDFGAWEGQPWDAVPRAALDAWAADPWGFAPPGGESGAALVARLRDFQAELRPGAIIVSHGGPLKVLAALIEGRPVDLLAPAPPMGICRIHRRPPLCQGAEEG